MGSDSSNGKMNNHGNKSVEDNMILGGHSLYKVCATLLHDDLHLISRLQIIHMLTRVDFFQGWTHCQQLNTS